MAQADLQDLTESLSSTFVVARFNVRGENITVRGNSSSTVQQISGNPTSKGNIIRHKGFNGGLEQVQIWLNSILAGTFEVFEAGEESEELVDSVSPLRVFHVGDGSFKVIPDVGGIVGQRTAKTFMKSELLMINLFYGEIWDDHFLELHRNFEITFDLSAKSMKLGNFSKEFRVFTIER